MRQCDAGLRIAPGTGIVGAAVAQGGPHRPHQRIELFAMQARRSQQQSCQSAHRQRSCRPATGNRATPTRVTLFSRPSRRTANTDADADTDAGE
ncbi:hypothetical protein WAE31_18675 (plasmid) [Xanthomonas axonopodis pv. vasculorum]